MKWKETDYSNQNPHWTKHAIYLKALQCNNQTPSQAYYNRIECIACLFWLINHDSQHVVTLWEPVLYTDIPEKYVVTANRVCSIFFPCHTATIFYWSFRLYTMPAVHVRRHCLLFISVNQGPATQHLPFTRRLQELTHALVPPWQNDWQTALVKLHQGGWGSRRACVCVSNLTVTCSCPTADEKFIKFAISAFAHLFPLRLKIQAMSTNLYIITYLF